MKIAAISDIHGNLAALEAVLADIQRHAPDLIVNLGDSLSGPLFPAECADLLLSRNILAVRGNHERQLLTLPVKDMGESDRYAASCLRLDHLKWIEKTPETLLIDNEILLTHGTPRGRRPIARDQDIRQDRDGARRPWLGSRRVQQTGWARRAGPYVMQGSAFPSSFGRRERAYRTGGMTMQSDAHAAFGDYDSARACLGQVVGGTSRIAMDDAAAAEVERVLAIVVDPCCQPRAAGLLAHPRPHDTAFVVDNGFRPGCRTAETWQPVVGDERRQEDIPRAGW